MGSFHLAGMLRDAKIGHGTGAVNRPDVSAGRCSGETARAVSVVPSGAVEMCGMCLLGDKKTRLLRARIRLPMLSSPSRELIIFGVERRDQSRVPSASQ
jgi:hypothetical protein